MNINANPNYTYRKILTGETGLFLQGGWSEEIEKEVLKNNFDILYLKQGPWNGYSFFEKIGKGIKKVFCHEGDAPISGFACLLNLESLVLSVPTTEKFSFSNFKKLKRCEIYWCKNFSEDLFDNSKLEELLISNYKKADFSGMSHAHNLRSLDIRQSQISNLNGIGKITNLEKLQLTDLKKLTDISGLSCHGSIKELHIKTCNNIEDFTLLGTLTKLNHLVISLKEIETLKMLVNLPNLESVTLGDTKVVDGDIEVLLDIPNLKKVAFRDKKHYNQKCDAVEKLLNK